LKDRFDLLDIKVHGAELFGPEGALLMGAHFLSDVIAGVLLGCGLCFASYAGYVGWSPPDLTTPEKETVDDDAHQVA